MSNYPKPRWEPAPENETYEERQARLKRVYGDNYDPDHKAKKWAQRDSYDNRPKQHYDKGSHDPRSRSRDAQEWNERNASRGSNFAPPSHPKPQYNRTNSSSYGNMSPTSGDNRRPDPPIDTRVDHRTPNERSVPISPLNSGTRTPHITPTAISAVSAVPTPLSKQIASESFSLKDELERTMRSLKRQIQLEDKRGSAQEEFDRSTSLYTQAQQVKDKFPAALYSAQKDYEDAKAVLSARDKELKKAEAEFGVGGLVNCFASLVSSSASIPSVANATIQEELEAANKQVEFLRQEVQKSQLIQRTSQGATSKAQNELNTMKDNLKRSQRAQEEQNKLLLDNTTRHSADIIKLKADMSRIVKLYETQQSELKSLQSEMSNTAIKLQEHDSKLREFGLQNINGAKDSSDNIDNVAFKDLESRVFKLETGQQFLRGLHEASQAKVDDISVIDKAEIEDVRGKLEEITIAVMTLQDNLNGFDADLKEAWDKITILETAEKSQPGQPIHAPSSDLALLGVPHQRLAALTDKQETLRKELKLTPAVFQALGDIPARMSGLSSKCDSLAESLGEPLDELNGEIEKTRESLKVDMAQQAEKLLDVESKIKGVEEHQKRDNSLLQTTHRKLLDSNAASNTAIVELQGLLHTLTGRVASINASAERGKMMPRTGPFASAQPNGVGAAIIPVPSEQMSSAASTQELKKDVADLDERLQAQYTNLNRRIELISTEMVGQGIIGSLSVAYPHLANMEHEIALAQQHRQEFDFSLTTVQGKQAEHDAKLAELATKHATTEGVVAQLQKQGHQPASQSRTLDSPIIPQHSDHEALMQIRRKMTEQNDAINNHAATITSLNKYSDDIRTTLRKYDQAIVATRDWVKALEGSVTSLTAEKPTPPNGADASKVVAPSPGVQRQLGTLSATIMDVQTAQNKLRKDLASLRTTQDEQKNLEDKVIGLEAHVESIAEDCTKQGKTLDEDHENLITLNEYVKTMEEDLIEMAQKVDRNGRNATASTGTKRSAEDSPTGGDSLREGSGRKKKKAKTIKTTKASNSGSMNDNGDDLSDGEQIDDDGAVGLTKPSMEGSISNPPGINPKMAKRKELFVNTKRVAFEQQKKNGANDPGFQTWVSTNANGKKYLHLGGQNSTEDK